MKQALINCYQKYEEKKIIEKGTAEKMVSFFYILHIMCNSLNLI